MNNYQEAEEFIQVLYPFPEVTFQTFSKTDPTIGAQIFHGTLRDHWSVLNDMNSEGAGIYTMINTGNGHGRDNTSVTSITNLLLDLDGSPLEPVLACPVKPHIVLSTSDGRFQGRWKIEPIPITAENRDENRILFKQTQIALAERFDGDPSVCDLARVARLPQFVNYNHETPFLVRTLQINDSPVLSIDELSKVLELNLKNPYSKKEITQRTPREDLSSNEPIYEGVRNKTLFRICRSLAYQELLGDDLLDVAFEINNNRCTPPLEEDEVRTIANSVAGYWLANSMTVEECVSNILERNNDLVTYKGSFYRFDTTIWLWRIMNTSTFTNDVFKMTGRTASRSFIDQVMKELCRRTRNGLPLHTPEAQFIEQHISQGGKAVLKNIQVEHRKWCQRNGYLPVNTGLRREIEFRTGVSLKDIKISGKKYHGFQGISLRY
ncbi:MAG: primase C-terminal domain-containing protein [Desulfomonilaceae bacterium]